MKRRYLFLVFLNHLGFGVTAPVLSLLLCAHGCTVQTLGLAFTVYAAVVVAVEIPSGVFADLFGRKLSYLLSCLWGMLSCTLLLFANSFALCAAGLMLSGLSVAFSSGSLDALAIEDAVSSRGSAYLPCGVSSLSIAQCAGIASGALLGGYLPDMGGFRIHLLLRLAASGLVLLGAWRFLREDTVRKAHNGVSLSSHFRQMFLCLRSGRALPSLVGCILGVTLVQVALETYWQPQLLSLGEGISQATLGYLCTGGYLATVLGSFLMGRVPLSTRSKQWRAYFTVAFSLIGLALALSVQRSVPGFSLAYLGMYLTIGLLSVPEQTIANGETPDALRASMLSVVSFAARAGGILSGAAGSLLLIRGGIPLVFQISSGVAAVSLAVICRIRPAKKSRPEIPDA